MILDDAVPADTARPTFSARPRPPWLYPQGWPRARRAPFTERPGTQTEDTITDERPGLWHVHDGKNVPLGESGDPKTFDDETGAFVLGLTMRCPQCNVTTLLEVITYPPGIPATRVARKPLGS